MQTTEKFLRLPEVVALTGRSRSSIYQDVADKTFPAPVSIGPRAKAWPASSIAKWQEACIKASKRG